MNRVESKLNNLKRRKHKVRAVVSGNQTRPRLSVHVSHKHVTAQLIDDTSHKTLAYVSTIGQKDSGDTLTDKAEWIGSEIAKKGKTSKVHRVVFDRNGRIYHGRIKALADAARKGGLEF